MGYYMTQRHSNFRIPVSQHAQALAAVKALAGSETIHDSSGPHFAWVPDNFGYRTTLKGILNNWRWNPTFDAATEDIEDLTFAGQKSGDDPILFTALAPFVDAESFLEMEGEDGAIWRWTFNGQSVLTTYYSDDLTF